LGCCAATARANALRARIAEKLKAVFTRDLIN